MDLWIRSQDRLSLEKVDLIVVNGSDVFSRGEIIGTYDTCERALEVLDEIQDLFITKEAFTTEFTKDGLTIMNKQPSSAVYEMPEEWLKTPYLHY